MPVGPDDLVNAAVDAGVGDERLLQAMSQVPRGQFVLPARRFDAYLNVPLPIPHGQVTTQPSLVAMMVEALGLEGIETVLEIGTGFGWQTALLARLAARVWSVERFADVAEMARANLAVVGATNVEVITGDGSLGLPEHAPFDAILVAAAFPRVPEPLVAQLAEGGRLVQPIGPGGAEEVVLFEKVPGGIERRRSITGAHFVRLHGVHGFSEM